jgi:hypothetical protein
MEGGKGRSKKGDKTKERDKGRRRIERNGEIKIRRN